MTPERLVPPILARVFFKKLMLPETFEFAIGDLEETFRRRVKTRGHTRARLWFWLEVFRSAPRALIKAITWRIMMVFNTMKTTVRLLRKHKIFSFINVTGLALGMACCMLILIWVGEELSFDQFHEKKERIFRVVSSWEKYGWNQLEASPAPLGPAIRETLPEIEQTARIATDSRKVFRNGDLAFYEERGIIADPALFKIITLPFLSGDAETAFSGPEDIVITASFGRKYFGEAEPLGRMLEMDGEQVRITGVIQDLPSNSTFHFDFMRSFDFITEVSGWGTHWGAYNFTTLVLVQPNAEIDSLGPKITAIARSAGSPQVNDGLTMGLQNILKVHLSPRPYSSSVTSLGDAKVVYGFTAIAIFIVIIACINFTNLSTARSSLRAREVAVRKTVGARRRELIQQFFGESFILTLIASLFAIILTILFLPAVNRLSGKEMAIRALDLNTIIGLAGIILITSLLAGIYPAFVLSRYRPVLIMRGAGTGIRKSWFRRILVIFQFSLSILLILATMGISRQIHFIRNRELGFEKENVLVLPIKEQVGSGYGTVKTELLRSPDIVSVSGSWNALTDTWRSAGNWRWEEYDPEIAEDLDMVISGVDFDFIETLDLELVEGRSFSREYAEDVKSESVILNEAAVRAMGIESPVGKWFASSDERRGHIVGVVRDVHFQSLYREISPRIFFIQDLSSSTMYGIMLIRFRNGRFPEARSYIQSVWEKVNPNLPFEYRILDQTYRGLYYREENISGVLGAFTLFGVFISCLGLFGLASFMAERRTKEIGIRKVLGAKESGLVLLLSGEFTRWVVVANLIAWPVGYILLRRVFQVYAYRTRLGPDVYLLSGSIALLIALFTVILQAVRTARSNPIDSLRYE